MSVEYKTQMRLLKLTLIIFLAAIAAASRQEPVQQRYGAGGYQRVVVQQPVQYTYQKKENVIPTSYLNGNQKASPQYQQVETDKYGIPKTYLKGGNVRVIQGPTAYEQAMNFGIVGQKINLQNAAPLRLNQSPSAGNGEQVVYRQVIINGDNNSKEALRLKEHIAKQLPGAKVQFQYQNAGADTPSPATFKDFSSIALKKSEILTLTPQVILKIRNHGLVEKFEAATRRNSFTAFLDSVTKALESVDHEYDLEKPLLNFLSSFKNLFLQLKNTKTDEVTKRTYALVDATNMQKLFGSLTAYIDVHDQYCGEPRTARYFCSKEYNTILNDLIKGFMEFGMTNRIALSYQRSVVKTEVVQRTVTEWEAEIDRRILKIEHLRFTINYKFIMTIFEAAKSLRAQTLPEKIDTLLVALLKDLATITNQVYERTFRSQQKEYRVFAMSITHAKLAVTKLISYIANLTKLSAKGAIGKDINAIISALSNLKTSLSESNQNIDEVEWKVAEKVSVEVVNKTPAKPVVEEQQKVQLARKQDDNALPQIIQIVGNSKEEVAAKKREMKAKLEAEYEAKRLAQEQEDRRVQLKIYIKHALETMTDYLRVYRENLAEVSRFYTVQHIQVILRLVYKIAKEQPYVLENYEPFEAFYTVMEEISPHMNVHTVMSKTKTYLFIEWTKVEYIRFIEGLKVFVTALGKSQIARTTLEAMIRSRDALESRLRVLPTFEDKMIEANPMIDLEFYNPKWSWDITTRKFVPKGTKVVVNQVTKPVEFVFQRRQQFQNKYGVAMWSVFYRNGNLLYTGLVELMGLWSAQMSGIGIHSSLANNFFISFNSARLRAANPSKGYNGRLTIEFVHMRSFLKSLVAIEYAFRKLPANSDPKLLAKVDELRDSIDILRSWYGKLFFDGVLYNEFKNPSEVSIYYPGCTYQASTRTYECAAFRKNLELGKQLIARELKTMENLEKQGHRVTTTRFFKFAKAYLTHANYILLSSTSRRDLVFSLLDSLNRLPFFWTSYASHKMPYEGREIRFFSLRGRPTTNFYMTNAKTLAALDDPSGSNDKEVAFEDAAKDLQNHIDNLYTSGHEFLEFEEDVDPAVVTKLTGTTKVAPKDIPNQINERVERYRIKQDETPLKFNEDPSVQKTNPDAPIIIPVTIVSEPTDNDEPNQPQLEKESPTTYKEISYEVSDEQVAPFEFDPEDDKSPNLEKDLENIDSEELPLTPSENKKIKAGEPIGTIIEITNEVTMDRPDELDFDEEDEPSEDTKPQKGAKDGQLGLIGQNQGAPKKPQTIGTIKEITNEVTMDQPEGFDFDEDEPEDNQGNLPQKGTKDAPLGLIPQGSKKPSDQPVATPEDQKKPQVIGTIKEITNQVDLNQPEGFDFDEEEPEDNQGNLPQKGTQDAPIGLIPQSGKKPSDQPVDDKKKPNVIGTVKEITNEVTMDQPEGFDFDEDEPEDNQGNLHQKGTKDAPIGLIPQNNIKPAEKQPEKPTVQDNKPDALKNVLKNIMGGEPLPLLNIPMPGQKKPDTISGPADTLPQKGTKDAPLGLIPQGSKKPTDQPAGTTDGQKKPNVIGTVKEITNVVTMDQPEGFDFDEEEPEEKHDNLPQKGTQDAPLGLIPQGSKKPTGQPSDKPTEDKKNPQVIGTIKEITNQVDLNQPEGFDFDEEEPEEKHDNLPQKGTQDAPIGLIPQNGKKPSDQPAGTTDGQKKPNVIGTIKEITNQVTLDQPEDFEFDEDEPENDPQNLHQKGTKDAPLGLIPQGSKKPTDKPAEQSIPQDNKPVGKVDALKNVLKNIFGGDSLPPLTIPLPGQKTTEPVKIKPTVFNPFLDDTVGEDLYPEEEDQDSPADKKGPVNVKQGTTNDVKPVDVTMPDNRKQADILLDEDLEDELDEDDLEEPVPQGKKTTENPNVVKAPETIENPEKVIPSLEKSPKKEEEKKPITGVDAIVRDFVRDEDETIPIKDSTPKKPEITVEDVDLPTDDDLPILIRQDEVPVEDKMIEEQPNKRFYGPYLPKDKTPSYLDDPTVLEGLKDLFRTPKETDQVDPLKQGGENGNLPLLPGGKAPKKPTDQPIQGAEAIVKDFLRDDSPKNEEPTVPVKEKTPGFIQPDDSPKLTKDQPADYLPQGGSGNNFLPLLGGKSGPKKTATNTPADADRPDDEEVIIEPLFSDIPDGQPKDSNPDQHKQRGDDNGLPLLNLNGGKAPVKNDDPNEPKTPHPKGKDVPSLTPEEQPNKRFYGPYLPKDKKPSYLDDPTLLEGLKKLFEVPETPETAADQPNKKFFGPYLPKNKVPSYLEDPKVLEGLKKLFGNPEDEPNKKFFGPHLPKDKKPSYLEDPQILEGLKNLFQNAVAPETPEEQPNKRFYGPYLPKDKTPSYLDDPTVLEGLKDLFRTPKETDQVDPLKQGGENGNLPLLPGGKAPKKPTDQPIQGAEAIVKDFLRDDSPKNEEPTVPVKEKTPGFIQPDDSPKLTKDQPADYLPQGGSGNNFLPLLGGKSGPKKTATNTPADADRPDDEEVIIEPLFSDIPDGQPKDSNPDQHKQRGDDNGLPLLNLNGGKAPVKNDDPNEPKTPHPKGKDVPSLTPEEQPNKRFYGPYLPKDKKPSYLDDPTLLEGLKKLFEVPETPETAADQPNKKFFGPYLPKNKVPSYLEDPKVLEGLKKLFGNPEDEPNKKFFGPHLPKDKKPSYLEDPQILEGLKNLFQNAVAPETPEEQPNKRFYGPYLPKDKTPSYLDDPTVLEGLKDLFRTPKETDQVDPLKQGGENGNLPLLPGGKAPKKPTDQPIQGAEAIVKDFLRDDSPKNEEPTVPVKEKTPGFIQPDDSPKLTKDQPADYLPQGGSGNNFLPLLGGKSGPKKTATNTPADADRPDDEEVIIEPLFSDIPDGQPKDSNPDQHKQRGDDNGLPLLNLNGGKAPVKNDDPNEPKTPHPKGKDVPSLTPEEQPNKRFYGPYLPKDKKPSYLDDPTLLEGLKKLFEVPETPETAADQPNKKFFGPYLPKNKVPSYLEDPKVLEGLKKLFGNPEDEPNKKFFGPHLPKDKKPSYLEDPQILEGLKNLFQNAVAPETPEEQPNKRFYGPYLPKDKTPSYLDDPTVLEGLKDLFRTPKETDQVDPLKQGGENGNLPLLPGGKAPKKPTDQPIQGAEAIVKDFLRDDSPKNEEPTVPVKEKTPGFIQPDDSPKLTKDQPADYLPQGGSGNNFLPLLGGKSGPKKTATNTPADADRPDDEEVIIEPLFSDIPEVNKVNPAPSSGLNDIKSSKLSHDAQIKKPLLRPGQVEGSEDTEEEDQPDIHTPDEDAFRDNIANQLIGGPHDYTNPALNKVPLLGGGDHDLWNADLKNKKKHLIGGNGEKDIDEDEPMLIGGGDHDLWTDDLKKKVTVNGPTSEKEEEPRQDANIHVPAETDRLRTGDDQGLPSIIASGPKINGPQPLKKVKKVYMIEVVECDKCKNDPSLARLIQELRIERQ
jgi:hypothetical protein